MILESIYSGILAFILLFVVMMILIFVVKGLKAVELLETGSKEQETRKAERPSPPPSLREAEGTPVEADVIPLVLDASGAPRPEAVAAVIGAIQSYLAEEHGKQQYVAATMAATSHAMPSAALSFEVETIDRRMSGAYTSRWAQVGRKKLLYRSQDIALLRQRKER